MGKKRLFQIFTLFILVVPVIVDFFNGFIFYVLGSEVSIGALYRIALLGATLPFVILVSNKPVKIWCSLLFIVFCISWLVWNHNADYIELKTELEFLSRIMFPYFLLSYFLYIQERYVLIFEDVLDTLIWFGAISGGFLIFSFVTGIGIKTYDDLSYGVQSFFLAVNDIGLCLLICFAAAMYRMMSDISLMRGLMVFLCFGGLLATGSRTGSAGAAGVFMIFLFTPMFYGKKNVKMSFSFKWTFLSILFLGILVLIKVGYEIIKEYPYMMAKFETLGEESARAHLEKAALERIENRSPVLQVFGEGTYSFHKYVEIGNTGGRTYAKGKWVEQDIMDFLGSYGYLLGGLLLGFPVFLLIVNGLNFLRNNRNFRDMAICAMLALFIFHAFTAGHALNSPTVSTAIVVAYFYVLGYKKIHQDEKNYEKYRLKETG